MGVASHKPYGPFTLAFKYLQYFTGASNGRGHGIHSPFVYDLIRHVFMDKKEVSVFAIPENHRKKMLLDHSLIHINDLGAGSKGVFSTSRKVKDIARRSLKSRKYARLLYTLTDYYKWENIIELGTSLGVSTAYLSLPDSVKHVYTIEGDTSVASIADAFFTSAGLGKIRSYTDTFDAILPELLNMKFRVDMVFIDGNHRKDPTLHYWNLILPFMHAESCVIFDDIHWSKEMEEVWEIVKNQPEVTCTIDLFFMGIVFFRKEFREVTHFQIRY